MSDPRQPRRTDDVRVDLERMPPTDVRALVEHLRSSRSELERRNAELHRIEQRLREHRDALDAAMSRYRDLFEFAPIGYLSLDGGGTILEANLTASVLLATSRSSLRGTDFVRWIAPADRERWRRVLRQALRRGAGSADLDVRLQRRDGSLAPAHVVAAPELGEWPGPEHVRVAVVDRTERERTEMAVRAGDRRMKLVAGALPLLVAYVEPDERFRFLNAAYSRWFDLDPQRLDGLNFRDVLGPDGDAALGDRLRTALAGTPVRFRTRLPAVRRAPAREVWASFSPDVDESGRIAGVFMVVDDQTALHDAESELRRAVARETLAEHRERRRFSSWLEEEIGQTLALAAIRLPAIATAPDAERGVRLQEIGRMLQHTHEQVSDLGFAILPPLLFDVGLAAAIEWLCERMGRDRGVEVTLSVHDPDVLASVGDVVRIVLFRGLQQILGAAAARRELLRVEVRLAKTADRAEVTVVEHLAHPGTPSPLVGWTARVEELGGSLTAEPEADATLRTHMVLPLRIDFDEDPGR